MMDDGAMGGAGACAGGGCMGCGRRERRGVGCRSAMRMNILHMTMRNDEDVEMCDVRVDRGPRAESVGLASARTG